MAQITLNSTGVASDGALALQSNGTTTAVTINTAQNMGLGATPSTWSGISGKALDFGAGSVFSTTTGAGQTRVISNAYYNSAWKYKATAGAAMYVCDSGNIQHTWSIAASGSADANISFTQAMTLDPSGNLGIGVTSPGARLDVYSPSTTAGTPIAYFGKALNSTATSNVLVSFLINSGGTGSGNIVANGANAAAFASSSDSRLKENIVDLPPQLDNIMSLRPVEFDYIESEGGGHQIGFVAQEVQAVYPDLVGERDDGLLTLSDMNKNDARLIKAIQELKTLVDTQASTITQLQADVAALKGTA